MDAKQVQLEAAIADSKVQAAKELSEAKVELHKAQDSAKVSLARDLERLTGRAKQGEERQVGLARKIEQLSKTLKHETTELIDKEMRLVGQGEFEQYKEVIMKRLTAVDMFLARQEGSSFQFFCLDIFTTFLKPSSCSFFLESLGEIFL